MYGFLPGDTPFLAVGHIFFLIWRFLNHRSFMDGPLTFLHFLPFIDGSTSYVDAPCMDVIYGCPLLQRITGHSGFFLIKNFAQPEPERPVIFENVIYGWPLPGRHLWMPPL